MEITTLVSPLPFGPLCRVALHLYRVADHVQDPAATCTGLKTCTRPLCHSLDRMTGYGPVAPAATPVPVHVPAKKKKSGRGIGVRTCMLALKASKAL